MIINHNMAALNTYNRLAANNIQTNKSLEKLSSGLRINRAGDDAAGLAISEKMRGQIRGLDQAARNAQDGISMLQTAEGALSETHSILQRMNELAVQAGNDTNTSSDRYEIQKEINQLTSEINRIGNNTEFNTQKLLNGDKAMTSTVVTAQTATYNPQFAIGAKWENQNGEQPTIVGGTGTGAVNNTIAFSASGLANGFSWAALDTSASGGGANLTISRAGKNILVSFKGQDTSGNGLMFKNQKMAFDDATQQYVYNANGISFSISAEEFEKFTDGAKLTLDLTAYDAAGSGSADLTAAGTVVSTKTDYEYNKLAASGAAYGEIASGISVNASGSGNLIEGVVGIRISGSNLAASGGGTYKVELLGDNGQIIVNEEFKMASGGAGLTYNQHGITFTFTANDTNSFKITQMFDVDRVTVSDDKSAILQIGANTSQFMIIDIGDMRANALGISSTKSGATKDVIDNQGNTVEASYVTVKSVNNGSTNIGAEYALDVSDAKKASAAIKVIDEAKAAVSAERSKLGAFTNRLEHTITNLGTSSENLTAAESRVRDVDMAKEMMMFQKNNILSQAAQAMLAQANQQPQGVLQLLR